MSFFLIILGIILASFLVTYLVFYCVYVCAGCYGGDHTWITFNQIKKLSKIGEVVENYKNYDIRLKDKNGEQFLINLYFDLDPVIINYEFSALMNPIDLLRYYWWYIKREFGARKENPLKDIIKENKHDI